MKQRALVCFPCKAMYRLRGYEGDPQYDMELIDTIDRHLQRADNPDPNYHRSQLFDMEEGDAKLVDMESELQRKLQEAGVYINDIRDELKLDALKCFNKHNRPQGMCPDWEDDSKIIGNKIGVPKENRQYLCHVCPCASHVAFKERQAMGMYTPSSTEKSLM